MLKRLLTSQVRDIIVKKINNTIEYEIPLSGDCLKNMLVYTVRIDNGSLKILFLPRLK